MEQECRPSTTRSEPPLTDRGSRSQWAIDDGGDCDHAERDGLGLGGRYDYERCQSCGAVFVSGPTA